MKRYFRWKKKKRQMYFSMTAFSPFISIRIPRWGIHNIQYLMENLQYLINILTDSRWRNLSLHLLVVELYPENSRISRTDVCSNISDSLGARARRWKFMEAGGETRVRMENISVERRMTWRIDHSEKYMCPTL